MLCPYTSVGAWDVGARHAVPEVRRPRTWLLNIRDRTRETDYSVESQHFSRAECFEVLSVRFLKQSFCQVAAAVRGHDSAHVELL